MYVLTARLQLRRRCGKAGFWLIVKFQLGDGAISAFLLLVAVCINYCTNDLSVQIALNQDVWTLRHLDPSHLFQGSFSVPVKFLRVPFHAGWLYWTNDSSEPVQDRVRWTEIWSNSKIAISHACMHATGRCTYIVNWSKCIARAHQMARSFSFPSPPARDVWKGPDLISKKKGPDHTYRRKKKEEKKNSAACLSVTWVRRSRWRLDRFCSHTSHKKAASEFLSKKLLVYEQRRMMEMDRRSACWSQRWINPSHVKALFQQESLLLYLPTEWLAAELRWNGIAFPETDGHSHLALILTQLGYILRESFFIIIQL
jgi:hypothetical protein